MSQYESARAEIEALCSKLVEGSVTDEERERIEQLVRSDSAAKRAYIEYLNLHAALYRYNAASIAPLCATETAPSDTRSPVLGFLSDVFQAGTNFFSRGLVVSLLLTIGLPGALFLLLILHVARQPVPSGSAMPVAKITQMHECVWGEGSAPLPIGADLFSGQQIRLSEGLVEIVFADGTNVIVQGPSTFETNTRGEGFLRVGSLVANVPKGAQGFTIRTPTATVVDLGTEFGVAVEDEKDTLEVQVFQGKVALKTGAEDADRKPSRHHLVAGRAVRIESAHRQGKMVVREVAFSADRFVRRLPAPTKPVKAAIIADFSGGEGNAEVDQFPGVAGSGWATGWSVGKAKGLKCITSIEQANPLLGSGKYLCVLFQRESGASAARKARALERRLAVTDQVDLTKPYVVSLNLRIDVLNRFAEARDRLSICSRRVSQVEYERERGVSSGWHICVAGKSDKYAKSRNWAFLQRDKKGKRFGVDSGIPAREGNTYSFRILVDPPARQWTPSIAVNGGKWTAFKAMGMRSQGTAKRNRYWPFLDIYCVMEGGNKGEDVEKIGFSVDSIRITPAGEAI